MFMLTITIGYDIVLATNGYICGWIEGSKMKHYIEIQRLRTQDVVVDDTLTLEKNTDAFIQGDIISITEKIDGANSSIYYDKKLDRLRCFSSKNELDFSNQLRGFLIYVKSLDMGPFIKYPNYIFFGEWLVSHTVIYDESNYNKWYLFSVYDTCLLYTSPSPRD